MSSDAPQHTVRAAHVPNYEGETIANPARSVAQVEVRFPELTEEATGRQYEGILIVFVREDGLILSKIHDRPVTLTAVYLDDGQPVTPHTLQAFNGLAMETISQYDLKDIWQDSRMFALYYESYIASVAARRAYQKQQEATARYDKHIATYFTADESGELSQKVEGVEYLTLDHDGNLVSDDQ